VGAHEDTPTKGLLFTSSSSPITSMGDTFLFLAGIYGSAQGGVACSLNVQFF
jgi:hypothetical protein